MAKYKLDKLKPADLQARVALINLVRGDTQDIITAARNMGMIRNHLAYALATTYHETAFTMKPIKERGGEAYLKAKKYYPHFGRGYVQATWLRNYKLIGDKLGVDIVSNPDRLLDKDVAIPALLRGMEEGWYTGKSMGDYLTLDRSNYPSARQVVNGLDAANDIAAYARAYDKLLTLDGYGVEGKQLPPAPPVEEPKRSTLDLIISIIRKFLGV